MEQFANEIDWRLISATQNLSEMFIEKHENEVNWDYISRYQQLSETLKQFLTNQ